MALANCGGLLIDNETIIEVGGKLCVAIPLPEFSASDNGKVLGVVSGELAWVSLGE